MSSRGAWPHWYEYGLDYRSDPQGREAYGIYAFKNELIYNGYANRVNATLPYWGHDVVAQVTAFQEANGLTADGILGPATALALFRKRLNQQNNPKTLSRIKTLESDNDPVAQGEADPHDEGLFQENGPSNPNITQIQCWTPSFIIPYASKQLASRIQSCGSLKAGTAAWNVGNFYAIEWRQDGYPASGKVVDIGNGEMVDVYARATNYYALVSGAAV